MALVIACIAAAYLIGAIPFGWLVARMKGVDIRAQGSGNIGATNVGRVLGRPYGYVVFGLDVLKGFLPTLVCSFVLRAVGTSGGSGYLLTLACVAGSCILGHVFPIYLRFRGGKGVATSLGALLGIYPYFTLPGVAAFVLWVVLTLTTRYVSVGSVGAAAAFPVLFLIAARWNAERWGDAGRLWPLYAFSASIALLVVIRHRGNLQRLYRGTESRIRGGGN